MTSNAIDGDAAELGVQFTFKPSAVELSASEEERACARWGWSGAAECRGSTCYAPSIAKGIMSRSCPQRRLSLRVS